MQTKILLVRHGESVANEKKFFAGQLDVALVERGATQAERTAKWIFENYSVDKIYSSDLLRAYETAKPIAKRFGMEIQTNQGLREIYAGDWQGQTFDELQTKYADSYSVWLRDISKAVCPNGESVVDLYERTWKTLREIVANNYGKTIVVVTHATPIKTLICRLTRQDISRLKDVPWGENAAISILTVENDEFNVVETNINKHLLGISSRFPANV